MAPEATPQPLRIVIVEDDPTFRSVLKLLFSEHWDVHDVADGETALEQIRSLHPHLVLADFRLPGMDGIELAHVLRQDPVTRSTPVVMLSGVAGPADRDRALDNGILDVLVKPVSERDLKRRVEAIGSIAAEHRTSLEAAQKRQQDAEERLRLLLEDVRDYAIVMLDPEGRIVGWNGGAGAMQGWTEEDVLGRHLSTLYPEEERGRARTLLGKAAVTRSAHDEGWQLRKDGSTFWADSGATALYTPGGGLRGFATITRDLTTRRLAEKERERLLEEARAANEAKERFLSTLSHELRTPLNAILGWVHLLRGGSLDAEKSARALEIIERNAQSQARLVEDILDLSRLLAGRVKLEREPTDVAVAASSALDAVRPAAAARQITLETDLVETPPVIGDARRLQQIVANLLGNAVKFSPPGGRVLVKTAAAGGRVSVVVQDGGPGIPEDYLPRLFTPFEQADGSPTRHHGGMGLGLGICKLLVDRHNGTIEVSTGRSGTTVTVEFPAAESQHPLATPAEETGAGDLHGLKVLVVDDHRDTAEFVSLLLRARGAAVFVALNATDGLETLQEARPDVLLADIEMPGHSGLDLIRLVRALPPAAGGATPSVAFTAYARAEDRDDTRAAGFDEHLAKPVKPEELVRTVAALGRQAPLQAANHHRRLALDAPALNGGADGSPPPGDSGGG